MQKNLTLIPLHRKIPLPKKGNPMIPITEVVPTDEEENMPDREGFQESDRRESASSFLDLHRDFGRLEGRVDALERTMTRIEDWLRNISSKLNTIQSAIDSQKGEQQGIDKAEDGREKKNGLVIAILGVILSALVAGWSTWYLVAHHAN